MSVQGLRHHAAKRWLAVVLCLLPLATTGCDGLFGPKKVELYRVGDIRRHIEIPDGESPEDLQWKKALETYEKGDLRMAQEITQGRIGNKYDTHARELITVIATRQDDSHMAESRLREMLSDDSTNAEIHQTLIWSLVYRGYLDEAENESLQAAKTHTQFPRFWDILAEIRSQQRIQARWRFWRLIWLLNSTILIGAMLGIWLYRREDQRDRQRVGCHGQPQKGTRKHMTGC